jgi:hypothetical protein
MKTADKNKAEKIVEQVRELRSECESLIDDMRTDFDDRSDSWKESDKGIEDEDYITKVEEMLSGLVDAVEAGEEL